MIEGIWHLLYWYFSHTLNSFNGRWSLISTAIHRNNRK